MEHIGIFGGSFNPPHIGHIRAAQSAAQLLGLTKVLLIPACQVPHKEPATGDPTPCQRLDMVRLAAAPHPLLEVSDLEVRRGEKSYTWDTIRQLRAQYPDAEFTLLLGSDMFQCFSQWQNANLIAQNAALAVLSRGGKHEQEKNRAAMELLCGQGAIDSSCSMGRCFQLASVS